MTAIDLATAYANAGKALLDLADALTASPDAPGAPSFEELPFDDFGQQVAGRTGLPKDLKERIEDIEKPSGSAAVCPAHNIEYRPGKYGPYCPSLGTDPKWTNDRGYCQITPAKAAAYLRQKAAA